jgi:thiamine kinase-like enzyme
MREMLPRFLDGMAGMHAEFWEDPALDDPRLGLNDPRGLLQLTSPTFVRQHLGKWDSWLLAGAVDGWGALQEALDDDAAAQARALIDDPQPLLEALGRHPSTFLHGDLYEPNLARNGDHLIAVDWQLAMHSVATIDLARLVLEACEDAASQARAVQTYRDRLEEHLGSRMPDDQWEEMVDLGILTEVLWIRPFLAWIASVSDDPAWVAKLNRQVDAANEQIRNGVRWLS